MKYLFNHWDIAEEKLGVADRLLLLFDYDGTLTPIVQDPEDARLDGRMREWLGCVARLPRVTVGIVSGRALADVAKLVSLRNVYYAGNHGLEIAAGTRRFVHPVALRAKSLLGEIAGRLKRAIRGVRGASINDKVLTLSVHYRRVRRGQSKLVRERCMEVLTPFLVSSSLKVTHGKKVLEVRPNVEWNKGDAVGWMMGKFGKRPPFALYVGDDRTDEDAFRLLKKNGLTIRVGRKVSSHAQFYVERTRDVLEILRRVYELWH